MDMSVSQHQQPLPEAPPKRRLMLPFIDTEPLFDVQLALLLLPVWWLLGIEQFIWPVIFGWATLKLLYLQRLRVAASPPLRWFITFLVAVLLSSLFIVEPERWFSYARNLGAFTAGFLVLLIITNRARSWKNIEKTLDAALIMILIAGGIGLLAIVGIWRPQIHSFIGFLLPSTVANTSYGQTIVIRTLGDHGWFAGLGNYFRVSGLFLFSNSYSSVLVYAIPFLFYKHSQKQGLAKIPWGVGIIVLLINLVYTTGRVATIGLLVGAIFFGLIQSKQRRLNQVFMSLGLSLAIILVLLTAAIELSGSGSGVGLTDQATEALDALVFARGSGSFTSRFGVYEATLSSFMERPLLGWGTERDHPDLRFPMGSHSEYLAILYRHGLMGFIALAGMLISTWIVKRPPRGMAAYTKEGTFLRYGRWFFVTVIVNNIMNNPSTDATAYVFLWAIIGLLVGTALQINKQSDDASATN